MEGGEEVERKDETEVGCKREEGIAIISTLVRNIKTDTGAKIKLRTTRI